MHSTCQKRKETSNYVLMHRAAASPLRSVKRRPCSSSRRTSHQNGLLSIVAYACKYLVDILPQFSHRETMLGAWSYFMNTNYILKTVPIRTLHRYTVGAKFGHPHLWTPHPCWVWVWHHLHDLQFCLKRVKTVGHHIPVALYLTNTMHRSIDMAISVCEISQ